MLPTILKEVIGDFLQKLLLVLPPTIKVLRENTHHIGSTLYWIILASKLL